MLAMEIEWTTHKRAALTSIQFDYSYIMIQQNSFNSVHRLLIAVLLLQL